LNSERSFAGTLAIVLAHLLFFPAIINRRPAKLSRLSLTSRRTAFLAIFRVATSGKALALLPSTFKNGQLAQAKAI
jgi:hypothetical protein